ncbi:hypothetical protein V5P93_003923 [Actinokineospora auranticolor]|uniref:Uncharacterized protein n=1 Tax=Actinokineospora auranticolor TaxID=155976 RepID=A0A2S6GLV6_9PSEU|nr:hypothetical protein [Actinokineospora auranticolor]PPK66205.1 hypothetical protein CLV40_111169 [Actinokineospora auranticolor]
MVGMAVWSAAATLLFLRSRNVIAPAAAHSVWDTFGFVMSRVRRAVGLS